MSMPLTLPQGRIALGWATVQGQRIPVEIDMEWMLALTRLVERTGGTSGDTNFDEYINQFFDVPPIDAGAREAVRAVDELRNELSSTRADAQALAGIADELRNEQEKTRADFQALRGLIEELAASSAAPLQIDQLRNRIASIEDRLA